MKTLCVALIAILGSTIVNAYEYNDFEVSFLDESIELELLDSKVATLRPDLNGLRMKSPANAAVYLIDQGCKRHIPNPATYNNLFRDWNGIVSSIGIVNITTCPGITNGAHLAKCPGQAAVWLIDNGQKRHIANPQTMDDFYFDWNKIVNYNCLGLSYIPVGSTIFPR